jgi:hypothetical protein
MGCDVTRGDEHRRGEADNGGEQRRAQLTPKRDDGDQHRRGGQHTAADEDLRVDAGEMLPEVIGAVQEIRRQEGDGCDRQ